MVYIKYSVGQAVCIKHSAHQVVCIKHSAHQVVCIKHSARQVVCIKHSARQVVCIKRSARQGLESQRDSPKFNVFCALSRWKVYGPFGFGESTVTDSAYLDDLQLWLFPQLEKSESGTNDKACFAWLSRSPDLTPCDFYLLGLIYDCVYVPLLPADLPDLRHRVEAAVARITSVTLNKAWDELAYLLDVCRLTNGAHMEHLSVFRPNLSAHVNKNSDPPEFLKQLALEVIRNIPDDALLIYTDGSRNEHSRSDSGIYIKSQNYSRHIKLRNSDGCSVFRIQLIAIDIGLNKALSIPGSNSIWILSDSRSVIQHLSNWPKVGDNTGVAILEKLKHVSSSREIHLQWVPSHVNIAGNEIADSLAKNSAVQHTMNSAALHLFRTALHLHQQQANNCSSCTSLTFGLQMVESKISCFDPPPPLPVQFLPK
ncbi:gag-pol [Trichonephila clavipes]|uniref:Gag-pol n=1 Tax=Trichonephila clavipes TaxID=2585209 RepID=A0A8X6RJP4_TRICX|nr:gag-pol [Trichonephila clavipes]